MTKHLKKAGTSVLETLTKIWPFLLALITLVGSYHLSQYRLVKTEDEIKTIKDKQVAIWTKLSDLKSEVARLDERTKRGS